MPTSLSFTSIAVVLAVSSSQPASETRLEQITAEGGSNFVSDRGRADRQARQRAEQNARQACESAGGRVDRVTSERIDLDRATATKFRATWLGVAHCALPASQSDETELEEEKPERRA